MLLHMTRKKGHVCGTVLLVIGVCIQEGSGSKPELYCVKMSRGQILSVSDIEIIDSYLGTLMTDDIEMFILRRRLKIGSNGCKLCLGSPGSTSREALASVRKLPFAQYI